MDQNAQQKPSITTFLLPIFTLFLGLIIGIIASRLMTPSQKILPQETLPQQNVKPQINLTTDLPISLRLLQNPAVYEWRGDVNGKVIAKDEHTLTLEDQKGNKITVTDLLPNGSGIFKTIYLKYLKKTGSRPIELTLKDITLGTMLKGEFFVFKNFPDTPIGSSFVIVE